MNKINHGSLASIVGMVASAREHDLDRLLYLIEIGGGGWQHHGRLCEEKEKKKIQ